MLNGGIDEYNFEHQCAWKLEVIYKNIKEDGSEETVVKEIGYPLTVDFNIQRNTSNSSNQATFNIYNLSPSSRNSEAFFQDKFNTDKLKLVKFSAGYKDNLIQCFYGYILESYSERRNVDVITKMTCLDLGTNNTQIINTTFKAGTTRQEAYNSVLQNCEGLSEGLIGNISGTFLTPLTLLGTPIEVLNQITEGHTFIDNGVVNTLQNNECLDIGVTVLNANTGLISTPQRRDSHIDVTGIFNPSVMVGQLLEINDPVFEDFNGTYKLYGFTHSGIISGAAAGQRTTQYNLLIGDYLPAGSYGLTERATSEKTFNKVTAKNKVEIVNGTLEAGAIGVYKYIHAHNGQLPNQKITKNISVVEMLKHDNEDSEILNELTVEHISNCFTIAKKLQAFLDTYTPGQKIKVNSGWRSKRNNASLKNSAKESLHLKGMAIDFRYYNINTEQAYLKYFKRFWDKFAYKFQVKKGSPYTIHVQLTKGVNGAGAK